MRLINRQQLEGELFIYQRSDVADSRRWCCSYKVQGHKRIYKNLGVCTQAEAAKLARQGLMQAEETVRTYGEDALLGTHTIRNAYEFFKRNGRKYVRSDARHELILKHWDNHLLGFFKKSTVIDRRLNERMSGYVEYRRRVVDKRSGKRLKATVATIRLELVSAKQLLTIARVEGGIGRDLGNITSGISKKKIGLKKTRTSEFQLEEIAKIQEFFDADRDELDAILKEPGNVRATRTNIFFLERLRFFVAIMFSSGCRLNEARQIRVGDISKDFKTLRIRKSKTTKGTNRVAFLDSELWDIESAYRRFMQECRAAGSGFDISKSQGRELFASGDADGVESMSLIGQAFLRFLRKHKMYYDKIHGKRARSFLAVRSTWITHQVNRGVAAYLVAQSAGTSLQMLEQTYYKSNAGQITKAFESVGDAGESKRHLKVVK